jgi:hypothetical protein
MCNNHDYFVAVWNAASPGKKAFMVGWRVALILAIFAAIWGWNAAGQG